MTLRSLLGYALFSAGGATFAFAGGLYAVGAWHRQDAWRAWNEAEARAVVALARSVAARPSEGVPIVTGAPVARLLVPRLQLDEIVIEGVDDYSLNAGPGHVPGSAFPGEQGNAVISAHRDRHFARLGDVRLGDTIVTESGTHHDRWIVISKRVVEADAPALFHTREATLTLTTCWPIRYVGTAPERLIVTATPLSPHSRDKTPSFARASST
jgi:sortase A